MQYTQLGNSGLTFSRLALGMITFGQHSSKGWRPSRPVIAELTGACMTVTDGLAIDADALRRKYREERDKRLRPDGNGQYLRLAGQLAHYLEDPYTPRAERAPKTDHVTAAFIGAGSPGCSPPRG